MFVHDQRLPHVLPPTAYHDRDHFRRELNAVLKPFWHIVGTLSDLAVPGDFLTLDIAGEAVQIRNFDGKLTALSNTCAHRHCLLTSLARGRSPSMRCQYHGWEYQCDGRTGRIPEPKNFMPFDREQFQLPRYHVERLGQLVFVSIAENPISLRSQLGEEFAGVIEERFGSDWQPTFAWRPEYPANWKVPIENSLEAYHVPAVHPNSFRVDPGESRSDHELHPNRTALKTKLPFSTDTRSDIAFHKVENVMQRLLGYRVTDDYSQHHVFPNLLFSFTDSISLCHCVMPIDASHSCGIVRQFGKRPKPGRGWLRPAARVWNIVEALVTKQILKEDLGIFASIQAGLERSSCTPETLGRRRATLRVSVICTATVRNRRVCGNTVEGGAVE
ncbi:MAG: aromatic ring-hydroxylating dioxygenase subunit alpha [Pirellulales bacterium]